MRFALQAGRVFLRARKPAPQSYHLWFMRSSCKTLVDCYWTGGYKPRTKQRTRKNPRVHNRAREDLAVAATTIVDIPTAIDPVRPSPTFFLPPALSHAALHLSPMRRGNGGTPRHPRCGGARPAAAASRQPRVHGAGERGRQQRRRGSSSAAHGSSGGRWSLQDCGRHW